MARHCVMVALMAGVVITFRSSAGGGQRIRWLETIPIRVCVFTAAHHANDARAVKAMETMSARLHDLGLTGVVATIVTNVSALADFSQDGVVSAICLDAQVIAGLPSSEVEELQKHVAAIEEPVLLYGPDPREEELGQRQELGLVFGKKMVALRQDDAIYLSPYALKLDHVKDAGAEMAGVVHDGRWRVLRWDLDVLALWRNGNGREGHESLSTERRVFVNWIVLSATVSRGSTSRQSTFESD